MGGETVSLKQNIKNGGRQEIPAFEREPWTCNIGEHPHNLQTEAAIRYFLESSKYLECLLQYQ